MELGEELEVKEKQLVQVTAQARERAEYWDQRRERRCACVRAVHECERSSGCERRGWGL